MRIGDPIGGMRFYESPSLVIREQCRFPRSKRKRIRKKWRKDQRNWSSKPDPNFYEFRGQGKIMGHPAVIAELKLALERQYMRETR